MKTIGVSSRAGFVGSLVIAVLVLAVVPLRASTLNVFAAASLTESLQEIATNYVQLTGNRIVFNFAASGPLSRQIEEGAPADVFFSADESRMDVVDRQGLLLAGTRQTRLSNQLVIVTLTEGSCVLTGIDDLAKPQVKRIGLGDIAIVPAGTYAREYLARMKLWASVEPKVVPCESVRAVLAAVESGNVDAGFVYRTDARISREVKVACAVPIETGPVIRYSVAIVKATKQPEVARDFLRYLAGKEAGELFVRRGFVLLPSAPQS